MPDMKDYDPNEHHDVPITLTDFVSVGRKLLGDFQRGFENPGPHFMGQPHTWNEWMEAFHRWLKTF